MFTGAIGEIKMNTTTTGGSTGLFFVVVGGNEDRGPQRWRFAVVATLEAAVAKGNEWEGLQWQDIIRWDIQVEEESPRVMRITSIPQPSWKDFDTRCQGRTRSRPDEHQPREWKAAQLPFFLNNQRWSARVEKELLLTEEWVESGEDNHQKKVRGAIRQALLTYVKKE
jgi:hypothetical protein